MIMTFYGARLDEIHIENDQFFKAALQLQQKLLRCRGYANNIEKNS